MGGRARRRARRAGLRPGAGRSLDRGRLHPAAERACTPSGRSPPSRPARPCSARSRSARRRRRPRACSRSRAPRAARCGRRSCSRSTTRWPACARLLARGDIGEVREVSSRFHFLLDDPEDIRMLAELAGGSIQDVGCYPIRLARLLFDAEPDPDRAIADAVWLAHRRRHRAVGRARLPRRPAPGDVVRLPEPRGQAQPRARHRRRDPHDEPVPSRGRRHVHGGRPTTARRRTRPRPAASCPSRRRSGTSTGWSGGWSRLATSRSTRRRGTPTRSARCCARSTYPERRVDASGDRRRVAPVRNEDRPRRRCVPGTS